MVKLIQKNCSVRVLFNGKQVATINTNTVNPVNFLAETSSKGYVKELALQLADAFIDGFVSLQQAKEIKAVVFPKLAA